MANAAFSYAARATSAASSPSCVMGAGISTPPIVMPGFERSMARGPRNAATGLPLSKAERTSASNRASDARGAINRRTAYSIRPVSPGFASTVHFPLTPRSDVHVRACASNAGDGVVTCTGALHPAAQAADPSVAAPQPIAAACESGPARCTGVSPGRPVVCRRLRGQTSHGRVRRQNVRQQFRRHAEPLQERRRGHAGRHVQQTGLREPRRRLRKRSGQLERGPGVEPCRPGDTPRRAGTALTPPRVLGRREQHRGQVSRRAIDERTVDCRPSRRPERRRACRCSRPALSVARSASKKHVANRCAVTATAATLRGPAACAPSASTRSNRSRRQPRVVGVRQRTRRGRSSSG